MPFIAFVQLLQTKILLQYQMSFDKNLIQEGQNICAWQESILVAKDFNIPIIQKNKQSRAHPKSTLRFMNKISNYQQIQNIHPSSHNNAASCMAIEEPFSSISNIKILKRKMKILDQNNDRWQQPISCYPDMYQKKRIMSGFIRPNVQTIQEDTKQSSSMRILSKSTQHYKDKSKTIRPSTGISRNQSNMANLLERFSIERAKTIHQKSSRPSTKHKIRCSNFIHKAINININQLQSSKMQKILKYLNKNK